MKNKNTCQPSHCSKGFTLIELLVVVAIIALLISILLPSLTKAKELAKRTVCLSNLKNIGSASHMYLSEYEGKYYEAYEAPYGKKPNRESAQGGIPREGSDVDVRPLNIYADSYELFQCPADKGVSAGPWSAVQPTVWEQPTRGTSYRFNYYGIAEYLEKNYFNPNRNIANNSDNVFSPDQFVVMADFNIADINWECSGGLVSGMYGRTGLGGSANAHEPFYDDPTSCILFQDGHCEHMENIAGVGGAGPELYMLPDKDYSNRP